MVSSVTMANVAPNAESPKPRNLEDAAQQFEAMMITQMLKSAKESDGDGDDSNQNTMLDMANSQFAKMLSANGGLGLSKLIIQELKQQDSARQAAKTEVQR